MARRSGRLGNLHRGPKVGRKVPVERLDYHEGLSANQVKIILREFGLDYDEFAVWMYGQTCPIVYRFDEKHHNDVTGNLRPQGGTYEYDLFRWIENKKKGTPLVWD